MYTATPNTIGYFLLHRLPGQQLGHIGAILVVDKEGVPLEFKCTEAIKPTPMQQSLYGKKLESHIAIKLCALPLLQVVQNKPVILFVNVPSFLAIREEKNVPPTLFIHQDSTQSPFIIKSHSKYETDKNNELAQLRSFDLIEPFERIKHAVHILGENNEKFR